MCYDRRIYNKGTVIKGNGEYYVNLRVNNLYYISLAEQKERKSSASHLIFPTMGDSEIPVGGEPAINSNNTCPVKNG